MFSVENTLGLPVEKFGTSGINTGDLISERLEKYRYKAEYGLASNTITVLHSSDLPLSVLHKILYENYNYVGWEPKVTKERNEKGDLQVRLACAKPPRWLVRYHTAWSEGGILEDGQKGEPVERNNRVDFPID